MSARRESPREVIVRFLRSAALDDSGLAARMRDLLGSGERETLGRLRPEAARRDYLAAHALARMLLAEIAGCDPVRIRIRSPRGGRPRLVAPPGAGRLQFSISHADGIALCTVAEERAVGADIESVRNIGPYPLELAEMVCSEAERKTLRAAPPPARAERLLHFWTLKEAVAKATGLGMRLSLTQFTVAQPGDGFPALNFPGATVDDTPDGWRLASLRLTPCHLAAVAAQGLPGEDVAFRFEELVPGGTHPVRCRGRIVAPAATPGSGAA